MTTMFSPGYKTSGTYDSNYQLHFDKKQQMAELFKRYDDDKKLAILDPYTMTNPDGQPTPDVINVTMNEAMVFWNRAAAIMNGANMQRVVFGKGLSETDTITIENFYDDIYYANDLMLNNAIFTSLYAFLIEQVLVRGAIAARILIRQEGDRFLPEIFPLDVRYFTYETDSTGLIWGAYEVTRTKAQIERDYGIVINGRSALVTDFWNDRVNEVYIASQLYKGGSQTGDNARYPEREKEHGLGYPPLIFMKSGAGLQSLADAGIMKYQGESIFASNRGLIPELHRAASIMMTITDLSFEGALTLHRVETGGPKPASPYGRRKVTELGILESYKAVPITEPRNSSRLIYNMLVGALQRGGLPNIEFGTISFPLSAVAIAKVQATKDAIFVPRLNALAFFFRAASQMIKKQYLQAGYQVELGEEGYEREYSSADIDKKFSTKYQFHSTSPEMEIANTSVGREQKALGMSTITIFTDTMKLKDPEGEINRSRDEKAEAGDIAITLNRRGRSMADKDGVFPTKDGTDLEAEMILQQLEVVLRQRAMGIPAGLAPTKGGIGAGVSQKPLVNLFDKGGAGGGGRQKPSDEAVMDAEEAEEKAQRREDVVARSKEVAQ